MGRILLVGNGPSVLDEPLGDIIDAFDGEVGRFNRFVLEPPEYTGTKAHYWIVAASRAGYSWRFDPEKYPELIYMPLKTRVGRNYTRKSTGIAAMQHFLKRGYSVVLHGFDHFDKTRRMHYFNHERMKHTHKHDKVRVDMSIANGYDVSYLKDMV